MSYSSQGLDRDQAKRLAEEACAVLISHRPGFRAPPKSKNAQRAEEWVLKETGYRQQQWVEIFTRAFSHPATVREWYSHKQSLNPTGWGHRWCLTLTGSVLYVFPLSTVTALLIFFLGWITAPSTGIDELGIFAISISVFLALVAIGGTIVDQYRNTTNRHLESCAKLAGLYGTELPNTVKEKVAEPGGLSDGESSAEHASTTTTGSAVGVVAVMVAVAGFWFWRHPRGGQ